MTFAAVNASGQEIKHTDTMVSIGDRFAIVCADAIPDAGERKIVLEGLRASGKEVITIDQKQLLQFAGNVLQLQTKPSGSALAISTAACLALRPDRALGPLAALCAGPAPAQIYGTPGTTHTW